MTSINEIMKTVIENKLRPTEKSTRFMKVLGKEQTMNALQSGYLSIKCNEDKTFDVIVNSNLANELEKSLTKRLKEWGYGLTQKGKKYLREQYEQDNLDMIIKEVTEAKKNGKLKGDDLLG